MYTAKFLPEIELRKTKLQNAMKNAEADAMLISSNTNLFYTSGRIFCGYTYIPVEGEILFFVRRPVDLKGDNVIYIRKPEDIPAIMHERGINMPQKLLLEDDVLTYNERIRLATIFTNATFDNSSQIIRNVRAIKTPYEIELIRESAAKHASMYHRIPAEYKDGMSDRIRTACSFTRLFRYSSYFWLKYGNIYGQFTFRRQCRHSISIRFRIRRCRTKQFSSYRM